MPNYAIIPSILVDEYLSTLWDILDSPEHHMTFLREDAGFGDLEEPTQTTPAEVASLILALLIFNDIHDFGPEDGSGPEYPQPFSYALLKLNTLALEFDIPSLYFSEDTPEEEFVIDDSGDFKVLADKIIEACPQEMLTAYAIGIQQIIRGDF